MPLMSSWKAKRKEVCPLPRFRRLLCRAEPMQEVLFQTSLGLITECSHIVGIFSRTIRLHGDYLLSLQVFRFSSLRDLPSKILCDGVQYRSSDISQEWEAPNSATTKALGFRLPPYYEVHYHTPRMEQHPSHRISSRDDTTRAATPREAELFFPTVNLAATTVKLLETE